jgi:hypothetical protein
MKILQPIPILLAKNAAQPALEEAPLPLKDRGSIFSMAQAVRWLDAKIFAVGRWDGSLSVFHCAEQAGLPPSISAALVAPSFAGVEMIARIKPHVFVSSNDGKSMVVWRADDGEFEGGIKLLGKLTYDESFGTANDGTMTETDGAAYFVSGHTNGFLLVWLVKGEEGESIELLHTLDMRSPNPILNPFPGFPQLMNIRGVERWKPGYVVTGSEDGDICLVNVVRGVIVTRMRYNETAQRGINDIDTCGDYLLLANCSVGKDDKNTWLYRIHDAGFELVDSVDFKVDENRNQVFNFCIDQAMVGEKQYFFAATEEGVVWIGLVEEAGLKLLGKKKVSTHFGAALAYENNTHLLAVAGDNIHLFEVQ